MKLYTIIKTWYSAGIYGNTWEYFTCIYTEEYNWQLVMNRFSFVWTYWPEERIREAMTKKGFIYYYTWGNYGRINKKDVYKNTLNESEAIQFIDKNII